MEMQSQEIKPVKEKMTTIKLNPSTKIKLDNIKGHHKDSYEEVITELIRFFLYYSELEEAQNGK